MHTAREVREHLGHPVVDADGHLVESLPILADHVRKMAGDGVADRFLGGSPTYRSRQAPILKPMEEAGTAKRQAAAPWWALPTDPVDRATAFVPALLHQRLDDLGIDFAILYPSVGLTVIGHPDDEVRRFACRAINEYAAGLTSGLGDRLTAVATVPCHDPDEAIAELDHAVVGCGLKAVMLNSFVRRPPGAGADHEWYDLLAIDSVYDYDPVWSRCVELGVAVTVHTPTMGLPLRASPSRYMLNHIGNFATGSDAFAKALVFGGVMERFPELRVAFLEGGVSFGVQLLGDLISRWEKRGGANIERLDPSGVDFGTWDGLVAEHGGRTFADPTMRRATFGQSDNPPAERDDFSDSGVRGVDDLVALFDRFFFGCEADDPTVPWSFGTRLGHRTPELHAMLGSDIGHWDVTDMGDVLHEAHELVDDGQLDPVHFRRFVCDNAVLLHGGANPGFFDGTPVASYAAELLEGTAAAVSAGGAGEG